MDRHEEYLRLYVRHQDHLRAFICSLVRDPGARDDVLQEVALVLWRKFDEFDTSKSFGAWARGIAANKIRQSRHKSGRLVALSPGAISGESEAYEESEALASEERNALQGCVEKLPPDSKRMLALRYEKSLKLREVAAKIGKSLDATHKTISRIREALRRCIQARLGGSLEIST